MSKKTLRGASALVVGVAAFALVAPMAPALGAGGAFQDDADTEMTQVADDYNNLDRLFRVAGQDRINTAIKLMNSSTKNWGECQQEGGPVVNSLATAEPNRTGCEVIIARSDDFADALSAGPLADVLDAPILLSAPGSSIDPRVLAAISGRFERVTLIGGTGVFTEDARVQLEDAPYNMAVTRNRGLDRYETAVGIAKRALRIGFDANVNQRTVNVYLATGVDFPDALAAGAAAADNDGVVLLTKDKMMVDSTLDFLLREFKTVSPRANGIEIHTVGGQAEAAAKSSIEDIADTNTGANRYATAALLAGKYKNGIDKFAIVSGEGFADGVAAAGWVANHDGAMLLTRNASLSAETDAALTGYYDNTDVQIVVVGGTGSVSQNVSSQLASRMTF